MSGAKEVSRVFFFAHCRLRKLVDRPISARLSVLDPTSLEERACGGGWLCFGCRCFVCLPCAMCNVRSDNRQLYIRTLHRADINKDHWAPWDLIDWRSHCCHVQSHRTNTIEGISQRKRKTDSTTALSIDPSMPFALADHRSYLKIDSTGQSNPTWPSMTFFL